MDTTSCGRGDGSGDSRGSGSFGVGHCSRAGGQSLGSITLGAGPASPEGTRRRALRPAVAEGLRMTLDEARRRAVLKIWPEAGQLLGFRSRSAAYEAARRGQIPTLRLGARLVVPVPALLKLLNDSER